MGFHVAQSGRAALLKGCAIGSNPIMEADYRVLIINKQNSSMSTRTTITKKSKPGMLAVSNTAQSTTNKKVVHNKKFPVVKATRTEMVNVINGTKGRFFTTTHIDKDGSPRTMNVIKSNKPASELGYILVYSLQDKGYRNLNPQTLTDVSFKQTHYTAKSKPRLPKVAA